MPRLHWRNSSSNRRLIRTYFLPIDAEDWSEDFIKFEFAIIIIIIIFFSNFAHNVRFINVFSPHYFKFSYRANTLYFKCVPNIYGAEVFNLWQARVEAFNWRFQVY